MANESLLAAEPRSERGSRPAGRLRRGGLVPAVVYGLGSDTVQVTVPARELNHILAGGANTLITLKIGGDDALALARQVQRHPTRGDLLHVDFIRVRTDVAVSAEVQLHLTGEPGGVRDGGVLEQLVFSVPIEAKPQDIPHDLEADVTHLGIGDQIRMGEIPMPNGVVTTLEPDTLVAQVIAPRVAEEEAPVEGEEGADGEAAADGEAPAADGDAAASDASGDDEGSGE
ncbi:MAG: 50S ribosomal protein L25 [Acidimicrobiia bacterium]|nr:50S ribosomal protein L25 [Acidimicrobiia bacterium]